MVLKSAKCHMISLIASRDRSSCTLSEEKECLYVYLNKQMKEVGIYEKKHV